MESANNSVANLFTILNKNFDKVYIITLKKSTDRQDRFKDILAGLNYEIFWGVNGYELSLDELYDENIYSSDITKNRNITKSDLTFGEIGCALSHLKIYQEIIDNNYKKVLILEDDIFVKVENSEKFISVFSELPDDWDLLYLGYLDNNLVMKFKTKLMINIIIPLLNMLGFNRYSADEFRRMYPKTYSENLDISGSHYGTHAYAVTDRAAKKILQFQKPVSMAHDNAIGYMIMHDMLRAYKVKEMVFFQDLELPTTIENRYQT